MVTILAHLSIEQEADNYLLKWWSKLI